jgi:hypothetical protein
MCVIYINYLCNEKLRKKVEKVKTHLYLVTFPPKHRVVYEIMWKNVVQPGRPQITI